MELDVVGGDPLVYARDAYTMSSLIVSYRLSPASCHTPGGGLVVLVNVDELLTTEQWFPYLESR